MAMRESWTIEPPCDLTPADVVPVERWAAEYGLIPRLLTLDSRHQDPVGLLRSLQDVFADLPLTSATVRLADIDDTLPYGAMTITDPRTLMELAGSWQYTGTRSDGRGQRWVNPNYAHATALKPSIAGPDERLATLERLASYGALTIGDIAPRFGISEESLRRWLTRHSVSWSEMRLEGIKRLARTCHTISKWGDWSEVALSEALPVKTGTLKQWIHRHARDTEFEVPQDPSNEPWFARPGAEQGEKE